MAEQVGAIYYDASINTANFKKDSQNLEKTAGQTAEQIGKSMESAGKKMTTFITLPILAVGGLSMKMAMELEATEAKYNTVFAGMTDTADGFIREFQKLTPATKSSVRSMASGIQDLLIPMGFMREEATKITGETMHIVGALTNFNSATHKAEDVSAAFSSALTGMYKPLKALGINTEKAEVMQKAMAMTGKTNTDQITKQEEALALIEIAYENSTDALAAYNEESLDSKSRLGLAMNGFKDLGAEIMYEFLPVIDKISEKIREFTDWIKNLTPEQRKLGLTLIGVAAAAGPVLIVVGKLIGFLPKLNEGFKVLSGVIGGITWPVALVVIGIAALTAAVIYLEKEFQFFSKSWDSLRKKIEPFIQLFRTHVMPVFKQIGEFIRNVFNVALDRLREAWARLQPLVEKLMPVLRVLGAILLIAILAPIVMVTAAIAGAIAIVIGLATAIAWVVGVMANAFSWVVVRVTQAANAISQSFSNAWEFVKRIFSQVGGFFWGIFNTVRNIFTNIGVAIGNAIGNSFRWIINSIIRTAVNTINRFIDGINGAIGVVRRLGININPIGRLPVPQLAEGGIVTKPTLAMVGEGGEPEAVIPLSKMNQGVTINLTMSGVMTSSPSDERAVARRLIERLNEELTAKGMTGLAI